jgi:hypothetical protein
MNEFWLSDGFVCIRNMTRGTAVIINSYPCIQQHTIYNQKLPVFARSKAWVCGRSLAGKRVWISQGYRCISVVSVVFCPVEVSASDWSPVEGSPTDCGVSGCYCEASIMRRPAGGCRKWQIEVTRHYCIELTVFVEEIIVDLQCGFWRNRSTADHKFCILQTLENVMWQSREELQIFTDFKKACEYVEGAVLFNISFSPVLRCNCLGYK